MNFVGSGGEHWALILSKLNYPLEKKKLELFKNKWLSLFWLYALCLDRWIHCHLGTQCFVFQITLFLNVLEVTGMKTAFHAQPLQVRPWVIISFSSPFCQTDCPAQINSEHPFSAKMTKKVGCTVWAEKRRHGNKIIWNEYLFSRWLRTSCRLCMCCCVQLQKIIPRG